MTSIYSALASEHVADLRRTADRQRLSVTPATEPASSNQTIALRVAQPDEGAQVARLAALDDAPTLRGEILLAIVDGEPIAALSLADGRVVANPFARTANAVALLRLRQRHLLAGEQPRGWRAILHPRLALH